MEISTIVSIYLLCWVTQSRSIGRLYHSNMDRIEVDNRCEYHPAIQRQTEHLDRQPRLLDSCFDTGSQQQGLCILVKVDTVTYDYQVNSLKCIVHNRFCFQDNQGLDCQRGFKCILNSKVNYPKTNFDGICMYDQSISYSRVMKRRRRRRTFRKHHK